MEVIDTKEKNGSDSTEENKLQIYELGYHLLPSIAEESLGQEVPKIKSIIEQNGGLFIGEEGLPKSFKLAYEISKVIENKKTFFGTANFGWIKFEAEPASILKIEVLLKNSASILRFILIKSVKESKMIVRKPTFLRAPFQKNVKPRELAEQKPISEIEVDKAIEDLIIE